MNRRFSTRSKSILDGIKNFLGVTIKNIARLFYFSISFKLTFVYTAIMSAFMLFIVVALFIGLNYVMDFAVNSEYDFIQVLNDVNSMKRYSQLIMWLFIASYLFGVLLLIKVGTKASRKMLNPIKKMTQQAKEITIQDLDARLDLSTSQDELRDLTETINDMLGSIQESYNTQSQFASDASHELKTPIAIIHGYADLVRRWGKDDKAILEESIEAIKRESLNMQSLVEKLLMLSRSDKHDLSLIKQEFEINCLLNEIIRETKMINSNHRIIEGLGEKRIIKADRTTLKQAIRVFIDNSIKYTQIDGSITITTLQKRRKFTIIVEDNGVGIPKKDLPHVFNKFYRVDKSRTKETGGHGLGLAIAQLIIDRHNGNITVESKVGVGTKVYIDLPYSEVL
ncbi:MAG: sensor histidine kinase [Alkaliphilus sp.]